MQNIKPALLVDQLKKLATTALEVQKKFDNYYERGLNDKELLKCLEFLKQYGISPDDPILQSILPCRLHISEYQVEGSLYFSSAKEKSFDVSLKLNGIPVHSFLELRYGSKEENRDKLSITVEKVPYFKSDKKV